MEIIFKVLLICVSMAQVLSQYYSAGDKPVNPQFPDSASPDVYSTIIDPQCVSKTTGDRFDFPTGQSMENLIALINRLEQFIGNDTDTNLRQHMGAENTAKLLLRRFRYDGYDPANPSQVQASRDSMFAILHRAFLFKQNEVPVAANYYFPDHLFKATELCSLFYMFSHTIYNTSEANRHIAYSAPIYNTGHKRQTYRPGQQNQYNQNQRQTENQRQYPGNSYNAPSNTGLYPIREEGVVSFRSNKLEAIAPARVLTGIIAGLTDSLRFDLKEVLNNLLPGADDTGLDTTFTPEKAIMALTLAELSAYAIGNDGDKSIYFGLSGEWSSTSCTTYYGLTSITKDFQTIKNTIKATKAEIRGGIDGYIIGKKLRNSRLSGANPLKLSAILRSYYTKPKITKSDVFTDSYCDRNSIISTADIQSTAEVVNLLLVRSGKLPSVTMSDGFPSAVQSAQNPETNGYNVYCNKPGGYVDMTAPCETPSDVIFVIDGTTPEKLQQSADIVAQITGNIINIRPKGGSVSIFVNSKGARNPRNPDIVLPVGTEPWPLIPVVYNSSNTGCAQCRINDFNILSLPAVANTGQYFKYLNQTLFFYEAWGPETDDSAVPAKSAVLIDFNSVPVAPDSGNDYKDYQYFKDQLRYRHRDVRFLSVAEDPKIFKDIQRDDTDYEKPTDSQLGPNLARKICDNFATFQYNMCDKKSDNVQYTGFITPGYRQHWAMYPEFFHKSVDIRFTFKAEDGDIRVCFDRNWPQKYTDDKHCRDIKMGAEEYYKISNPCKGESLSSCDPFYFVVWGRDRTSGAGTQCLDERCMSLDQIKFTVTHKGVQCSSSNQLSSSTTTASTISIDNRQELSCTFEIQSDRERLCGFENLSNSCALTFEVVSSAQGFKGPGPTIDHTLSNKFGRYLHLGYNQNCMNKTTEAIEARLLYKNNVYKSSKRLFFWYQMTAHYSLSVGIVTKGSEMIRLWHSSHEVKEWTLATVYLDGEETLNVQFLVKLNPGQKLSDLNNGFVAIDDIIIETENE